MSKNITLLLLAFICSATSLLAQLSPTETQGKISYLQVTSFPGEETAERECDLFFSQTEGLYIRQEKEDAETGNGMKPKITSTDYGTNMSFNFTTAHRWPVHVDLTEATISAEVVLFTKGKNKEYLVKENIFPIRWKLNSEEKEIGGLLCRKATGYFRGRNYEAWYTPEIPVSLGPWKFQGLPGVILEVYDQKKEVFFSATAINLPANAADLPPTWLAAGHEVEVLSLQESVQIGREQKEEVFRAIQARLPRGATFQMEEKAPNAIETAFEFNVK